jgi:hypothetical protein
MNGAVPADPWSLVSGTLPGGYRLSQPVDVAPVTAETGARGCAKVLDDAGAARRRDAVDAAIVAGVRTRTGRQIDSQKDVGGWPLLKTAKPLPDSDGDGMPDAWERRHELDPRKADGNEDPDGDGYTNIENYLADLAGERS